MRPPNAAALPESETTLCPLSVERPPSATSMRAVRSIDPADDPVVSEPLPKSRSVRDTASTSLTSMSPRKESVAGPTRTVTVPL